MRYALLSLATLLLAAVLGCGDGFEGRKAPSPGTSDPNAVISQMQSTNPKEKPSRTRPAANKPAGEQEQAEKAPEE